MGQEKEVGQKKRSPNLVWNESKEPLTKRAKKNTFWTFQRNTSQRNRKKKKKKRG